MSIKAKLEEWHAAGLLGAEAVQQILLYEEQRHRQRPYLLYAVGGLGALAVGAGILALVGANWDAIPAGLKLAIDLLLVAGLSAGAARAVERGAAWAREVLLILAYAVVLASIGLVSQVYHQGGEAWQALLIWSALCAPLMSYGRSAVTAGIWLIGMQATYGAGLIALAEVDAPGASDRFAELALGLVYLAPLACLGLAGWSRLERVRPQLSRALRSFGWAELCAMASLAPLHFYNDYWRDRRLGQLFATFGLAALATAVLFFRAGPRGERHGQARAAVRLVLVAALLSSFAPFLTFGGDDWGPAAALAFIAFWAAVGWAGYTLRRLWILNLATGMIGLRIVIIYVELFGSLLDTGLGLILGGLLTLGITWLWVRQSKRMKQRLGAPKEEAGDES